MKPIQIATDILPLGEFKARLSEVLRTLRENHRPIIVTQNGKPTAVVITPEEFDELRYRQRFVSSIERGLSELDAGAGTSDAELRRILDAEFGSADKS